MHPKTSVSIFGNIYFLTMYEHSFQSYVHQFSNEWCLKAERFTGYLERPLVKKWRLIINIEHEHREIMLSNNWCKRLSDYRITWGEGAIKKTYFNIENTCFKYTWLLSKLLRRNLKLRKHRMKQEKQFAVLLENSKEVRKASMVSEDGTGWVRKTESLLFTEYKCLKCLFVDFFSVDPPFISIRNTLSGQTFLRSTWGPRYNNFQNFKENFKVPV